MKKGSLCLHVVAMHALSLLFATGCVTTFEETRTQSITVVPDPSDSYIWQKTKKGKRTVGKGRYRIDADYTIKRHKFNPIFWLVPSAVFAAGTGMMIAAGTGVGEEEKYDYTSETTKTEMGSTQLRMYIAGGLGMAAGTVLGIISAVKHSRGNTYSYEPYALTLGATQRGFQDESRTLWVPKKTAQYGSSENDLKLPKNRMIELMLRPDKDALRHARVPHGSQMSQPPPIPREERRVPTRREITRKSRDVVAVFDIQDPSRQFKSGTLDQLTDYLSTQLTFIVGLRAVPRDQLKERLVKEKRSSYKQCYDQTCQIDIGKALAASKSLATKILRVGNKCALTTILYDLKTETAERAASAKTGCSDDQLMEGVDQLIKSLSNSSL